MKPGELYFIREIEARTNKLTPFVKIGIVRGKAGDTRTSHQRALEHQTGNPREIFVDEILKTDAVQSVERILHWTYSFDRVWGEWFQLNEKEFTEVKRKAKELSKYLSKNFSVFVDADKFKSINSNSKVIKPSKQARDWHQIFLYSEYKEEICKDIDKKTLAKLKDFGFETSKSESDENEAENLNQFITNRTIQERYVLDENQLKIQEAKKYSEFLITNTINGKGSFLPIRPKNLVHSLKGQDAELSKSVEKINQFLKKPIKSMPMAEELHSLSLQMRAHEAKANLDKEIALAHLKKLCGKNAGIEAICSWKRQSVENSKFDKDGFAQKYPEIFKKFQKKIDSKESVSLSRRRTYKRKRTK